MVLETLPVSHANDGRIAERFPEGPQEGFPVQRQDRSIGDDDGRRLESAPGQNPARRGNETGTDHDGVFSVGQFHMQCFQYSAPL
jgi:hypothetical protein